MSRVLGWILLGVVWILESPVYLVTRLWMLLSGRLITFGR
jgi:hypothetical protein